LQRTARDQGPHPLHEELPAAVAGHQAERLKHAADLVGEVDPHAHELRAGGEQRADQMAVHALDHDLAIPADPGVVQNPPFLAYTRRAETARL